MPYELTEIKKKSHFEVSSLILRNNHFLMGLWHATKSGFYMTTHSSMEEVPKHFPKLNLYQKKVIVTVWWSVASLIHYSFLNPDSYIWWVYSANWWDALITAVPTASTGQQKRSNSSPSQCLTACHTTNASKVEWIGLWGFASPTIFTDLLPTDYLFFKHLDNFLQGKCFHNQ